VDRIQVGPGHRGPITEAIQKRFFDIVSGRHADEFGWLTAVSGVTEREPVSA
jgi:branched-chain amino acid aminotransferase